MLNVKQISSMGLFFSFFAAAAFANGSTPPQPGEIEIPVVARQFDFTPGTASAIVLRQGQPVVLSVTTQDRKHGFFSKELNIDETVVPGKVTYIHINPTHAGTFQFHCSVFCGSGHEGMQGTIVVQ